MKFSSTMGEASCAATDGWELLKAAVCPQCGEVSVYVDDPDTVINGWR